jgi:uncharacterized protein with FMN-binding domain
VRRVVVVLAGIAAGTALLLSAKAPIMAGQSIVDGVTGDPESATGDGNTDKDCVSASPSTPPKTPPATSRAAKAAASSRARSSPSPVKPTPAASSRPAQMRAVTGPAVNHRYGPVQVKVVASGDRIVDVVALQLPTGRTQADEINGRAAPKLRQQALVAQSAHINTVSGATLTSRAYRASLQAALDHAAIGQPHCQ